MSGMLLLSVCCLNRPHTDTWEPQCPQLRQTRYEPFNLAALIGGGGTGRGEIGKGRQKG